MLPHSGTSSFTQSRLGLQQIPSTVPRVRNAPKSSPKREGVWAAVTVLREHPTSPSIQCLYCGASFCGGATHITVHITEKCTCDTEAFLTLKQNLIESKDKKDSAKRQKSDAAEVDAAAIEPQAPVKIESKFSQQGIQASLKAGTKAEVDESIAECFYACNIPPAVIDHPVFKKMIKKAMTAPASYKAPDRHRLTGDLLDKTTQSLKAKEAPVREVVLKDCGTVVSDGWDDAAKNHLINFLVGTAKGFFFDGTIMLKSEDSENADRVAELICAEIEAAGKLSIIQVVTDTCSVMKAAWKIIEAKLPWITCTCCGPHVLSLELSDMGKIPEVAAVIKKVGRVLNRFWGRKRWARTKLREVAEKNHKKKIGLYRAKVTRFAGKVREMARMLRLKADLQEVRIAIIATLGSHEQKSAEKG
jgi:hypothetical protein